MAQDGENEPTMEEILASIRRIISEDEEEEGAAEGDAGDDDAGENEAGDDKAGDDIAAAEDQPAKDDVLELTDPVDEDRKKMAEAVEIVIMDREDEPEPEPEPERDPTLEEMAASDPEPEPAPSGDELISDATAAAAAGVLGRLSSDLRISDTPGQTLEGIVRELLRPMLKDWLDHNLRDIVEAKVEEAIDKVHRQRG